MVDQGVEPYLVSSSLVLVIAQRLVRTICKHCRVLEPDQRRSGRAKLQASSGSTPERARAARSPSARAATSASSSGYAGPHRDLRVHAHRRDTCAPQIMEGATACADEALGAIERGMITLRTDGVAEDPPAPDDPRRGPARHAARRSMAATAHRGAPDDADLRVQGLRAGRRRSSTGVIDADTAARGARRLRRENILVSEIHELRGGRAAQARRRSEPEPDRCEDAANALARRAPHRLATSSRRGRHAPDRHAARRRASR